MRISEVVSIYIAHKRSMGYRFRNEEYVLRSFFRAVGDGLIEAVGEEDVLAYLNSNGQITETWFKKYHIISGLYKFALGRGLTNVSPLPHTIPKSNVVAFVPYIYSHDELKHLLEAVPAACSGRVPIEEVVLKTFILLLYGAGLRISEALALTLREVDTHQACLSIRETKFFKSRLVPMGKDLNKLISEYIATRHGNTTLTDVPLFCFRDGSPLSQSAARNAFRRMRTYAGVQREGGARRQPRLHDLRHTAAVHRLIAWYQSGADLQYLLPKLATYLGHVDLSSTQRYLTLTPELFREASMRFEHYAMEVHHD